jgi:uncharacterized protein (TIGR00369 family)
MKVLPSANQFEPQDPDFEARVRASFLRQQMMGTLGAKLASVQPGVVEIVLEFRDDLTQQNGFMHAAAIAAIADSSCGYAAMSLLPADRDVLSVEFKVNLLAPAVGERFVAIGRVLRPGRSLTVCTAEVRAHEAGAEKLVAAMQATMIGLAVD